MKRKFDIGIAPLTALDVPPLSFVRMASAAGYSSIGLRLFPAAPGALAHSFPVGSTALRELKTVLDGEGVRVFDVEVLVLDAAFTLDGLEPVLASAQALGAKRLTCNGDDADRGRLIANFAAVCALSARHDLAVDMENTGWRPVRTVEDALEVVERAGMANAGVLVDSLHLFRNGGTVDLAKRLPRHRLRAVQLCDASGPAPSTREEMIAEARGRRLPPGTGDLSLLDLVRALPDDVAISVEVPMVADLPVEVKVARIFDATEDLLVRAGRNA